MMGKCYQCLSKIGRKSANGFWSIDKSKFRQVAISLYIGKKDKVPILHIPVCKDCVKNIDFNLIEKNLGKEEGYKILKGTHDKVEYLSHKIEIGGSDD